MEYISYLLIALLLVYIRQILFFYRGLSRLTKGTNVVQHTITVIIPARNEEENIEQCLDSLMNQSYPANKFSIIIVDDQSSDRTSLIVKEIAEQSPCSISLLQSDSTSSIRSPKIRALMMGIQHSDSEIIVTTDADCTASPKWIESINAHFENNIGIVTGLTVYDSDDRISMLFRGIQYLDFISYTTIAAGAIGMNRVLVSNGSNMAFRIQAFDDSNGFEALTHINTGDDSLLAQKIARSGKWKARFAFGQDATIKTKPVRTWKEFLYQRMRWVGQTAYFPPYMMFFMICTFLMYVLLSIFLPMSIFTWNQIPWLIFLGVFSVDYLILRRFTSITITHETMKYFIPFAIIHIPFVLISTIGGYFFSFEWKSRKMKKIS